MAPLLLLITGMEGVHGRMYLEVAKNETTEKELDVEKRGGLMRGACRGTDIRKWFFEVELVRDRSPLTRWIRCTIFKSRAFMARGYRCIVGYNILS